MSSTSSVIAALKDEPSPPCPWWTNPYLNEGTSDLWTYSKFKDFQIFIGDKALDVHKCVLAVRSPVFAAMFQSGLSEAQTGQMEILDFDFDTVQKAIKFCYCNSIFFEPFVTSIWNMLTFGQKYDIQHLVKTCLHHIKLCRRYFDNSQSKFLVKSAFDLGCDEILDQILNIFGVISGEFVPDSCLYPALGDALVKEEYYKDLKIICDEDGTELSVHKYIFALRSTVFAQIFDKMAENGDTLGRLTINKIKSAAVQKAVEFLQYIGYIADEAFENNQHPLIGLLEFADKFQVKELVSFCLLKIDQSKKNLDKEVVLTYIQTAAQFESKKILQFIQEIFGTIGFDPFDFDEDSKESYWN